MDTNEQVANEVTGSGEQELTDAAVNETQSNELGDAGKKALDAERKARRDAEKQLKTLSERIREIEDAEKSELQKANERLAELEAQAKTASLNAMRIEVAAERGLTTAQARRLVGDTREEIENDADELLALFRTNTHSGSVETGTRPKERLRSGTRPEAEPEETDPEKLAAAIRRGF